MKTRLIDKETYEQIKGCMDSEFYEQTVKEQGEPKTPEEYRSFIMAYIHNDRIDRNGEAREAYRAEHERPPLSLMMSDPVEYDRREHDFHENFPVKTFTDVVREQTGITIKADLTDRMYFYTDGEDEPTQEKFSSEERIPVGKRLEDSAGKHAKQHDSEAPGVANIHILNKKQFEL